MLANCLKTAASLLAATALWTAASVHAQIVVGGGSPVPQPLYETLMPSGVGLTSFSYTGIGSNGAKQAFLDNNATSLNNESLAARPAWSSIQSVHFAAGEAPLNAVELSNYNMLHGLDWGPLAQLPALALPVLLPFKRTGLASLNLGTAKMCALFASKPGGQTWGQLLSTSDPTPVKLVYRTDTNGLTEALSRYLVNACPAGGFTVSNNFATMVGGALPGGTIPSQWVAVSGDSAMAAAMTADGRIGYLAPNASFTGTSPAVVAQINGTLPVTSAIQAALATQPLPAGAANNPMSWLPPYATPAPGTTYPIVALSGVLINQCYRDAVVQTRLRNFLNGFYGLASLPSPYIALPAAWRGTIASTFLAGGGPLSVGNVSVCNAIGRPLQN